MIFPERHLLVIDLTSIFKEEKDYSKVKNKMYEILSSNYDKVKMLLGNEESLIFVKIVENLIYGNINDFEKTIEWHKTLSDFCFKHKIRLKTFNF